MIVKRTDIIERLASSEYQRKTPLFASNLDKRKCSQAISRYFHYMYEALLEGKKWNIERFATLQIVVDETKSTKPKPFPKYYKDGKLRRNKNMFNPRTMGTVFTLVVESDFLDKHKCRFKSADWFRGALSDKLFKEGEL